MISPDSCPQRLPKLTAKKKKIASQCKRGLGRSAGMAENAAVQEGGGPQCRGVRPSVGGTPQCIRVISTLLHQIAETFTQCVMLVSSCGELSKRLRDEFPNHSSCVPRGLDRSTARLL